MNLQTSLPPGPSHPDGSGRDMLSPWGKCVTQSDRDTHLQLVLRRHVWFQLGVPTRPLRKGFLALPTASEAINRNDSWAGGPGPRQPQRQGPPDSRSPVGTLGPVLWVSEVREEAIKIVITVNTLRSANSVSGSTSNSLHGPSSLIPAVQDY